MIHGGMNHGMIHVRWQIKPLWFMFPHLTHTHTMSYKDLPASHSIYQHSVRYSTPDVCMRCILHGRLFVSVVLYHTSDKWRLYAVDKNQPLYVLHCTNIMWFYHMITRLISPVCCLCCFVHRGECLPRPAGARSRSAAAQLAHCSQLSVHSSTQMTVLQCRSPAYKR